MAIGVLIIKHLELFISYQCDVCRKGALAHGGSKGMWSDKRDGTGRTEDREVVEGQSLENWFCFLYVSDVLRLPAPFPAYHRAREKGVSRVVSKHNMIK